SKAPSELLGVRDRDCDRPDTRWRHFFRLSKMPRVKDHVVNDPVLYMYPAAGMPTMAIKAAENPADPHCDAEIYPQSCPHRCTHGSDSCRRRPRGPDLSQGNVKARGRCDGDGL